MSSAPVLDVAPQIASAAPLASAAPADPDPCKTWKQNGGSFREPRQVHGAWVPATIPCGASQCAAGREVCCPGDQGPSNGTCVPASPGAVRGSAPGCSADRGYVIACDDSSDCASGETCCLGAGGGSELLTCEQRVGAFNQCERGEVCRPGSPCRTPGTLCREGICQAPAAKKSLACGKVSCGPNARFCCLPPRAPGCHEPAKCEDDANDCYLYSRVIECLSPKHCPAHQRCQAGPDGSTTCASVVDAAEVCDTAKDCSFNKGRARCTPAPDAPYKICS